MSLRCPRCGAPVEREDTFCGECGCPLRELGDMGAPGYDDLPEEGPGRKKHMALIIVLLVLIVAVLAGFGGLFLFHYMEGKNDQEVTEELREDQEESQEETDEKLEDERPDVGGETEKTEEPAEDPAEDPTTGATDRDYIFPDSASRYLTDADVEGLTIQEINYGKNEIYARHGRRFQSQELMDYFESKSWYQGLYDPKDFDDNYAYTLNEYERRNAEFLNVKEHELDTQGYIGDAN